jgi:hypothetical protein
MVIERNLEQALGATVKLAFLPAGVQCDVRIPAKQLVGAAENRASDTRT